MTVSAAVLDLGYINWKGSETTMATINATETENITAGNYQEIADKYSSTDFLNMDRFNLKEDGQSHDSEKRNWLLLSCWLVNMLCLIMR